MLKMKKYVRSIPFSGED